MKEFKRITAALLLILLLAASIIMAEALFYPLTDTIKNWKHFYSLPKDSIDVLITGNSHAYASFDCTQLNELTGKNTYILANSAQPMTQVYFTVKEALRRQTPSDIIVEASCLDNNVHWRNQEDTEYDRGWKKDTVIDAMRLGPVKIQAVFSQYLPENWAYGFGKLSRCHANWKQTYIIQENLDFIREGIRQWSCTRSSYSSMSEETRLQYDTMPVTQIDYVISEENVESFRALAELCRSEGIALHLVFAPLYRSWTERSGYERYQRDVRDLAQSEGVELIDCNAAYDDIGLIYTDFEDFFSSYHHLNADGTEKVTDYVAHELFGQGA